MSATKFVFAAVVVFFMLGGSLSAQTVNTDPEMMRPGPPGVNATWRWSLTPNGGYSHVQIKDTKVAPIPWHYLREEDVQWKRRVWREITITEKQNLPFAYAGDEHTGGGMLIEILTDAVKRGKIQAYANTDDRFTTIFTKDQLEEQLRGKPDTIRVHDPFGDTDIIKVVFREFDPASVTKFRLVEDWIFDNNTGQMVVRIVGIAPVRDIYGPENDYRGSQAMFWLYYPDIRNLLAGYEAINPVNDMQRMTWVDFLESRSFSSRVTKMSNAHGTVAGNYGESFSENGQTPMEALYSGQRASNMIANREHDVWEY